MSVDLPELKGFVPYYGVQLCPIGDDGDWVLALGHHEPLRIVAALNQYAREVMGLGNMMDDRTSTLAAAIAYVEKDWARLATLADCEARRDDQADGIRHDRCDMCEAITTGGWWLVWGGGQVPDSFPVTVWST